MAHKKPANLAVSKKKQDKLGIKGRRTTGTQKGGMVGAV